jgi:uncharacterized membrane protein YfcA
MDTGTLIGLLAIGFAAGMLGGLVGVGGGILFVPGLIIFLHEPVLTATSTSLVAVVIVAIVAAWRQRGYGNVRLKDAALVALLSPVGVLIGWAVSNAVPERAIELSFAAFQIYMAYGLLRGKKNAAPPEEPVAA